MGIRISCAMTVELTHIDIRSWKSTVLIGSYVTGNEVEYGGMYRYQYDVHGGIFLKLWLVYRKI